MADGGNVQHVFGVRVAGHSTLRPGEIVIDLLRSAQVLDEGDRLRMDTSMCFIAYSAVATSEPLWLMIGWSSCSSRTTAAGCW